MKDRNKIDNKFKWKVTDIYATEQEFEKDLTAVLRYADTIVSYKGKLNNADNLLNYFNLMSDVSIKETKLYCYTYLNHSAEISNTKFNEQMARVESELTKISYACSFADNEIMKNGTDFLEGLLKDKRFIDYDLSIKNLIRNQSHLLNEDEQKIVSLYSELSSNYQNIFHNYDSVDIDYGDFVVDGKKYVVTEDKISELMMSKNREVRKNTSLKVINAYIRMKNTIGNNYISQVKADKVYKDINKFNSTKEEELFGDNLSVELYDRLINSVRNNIDKMNRYYKIRKRALKVDTLYPYDMQVPIVKVKQKYTYDEMCDIVVKALSVLGEKYTDVVKKGISSGWIDVYPNKDKYTGAYSMSVYGVHPYILLNTTNDVDSMFTLAHEMGHAMHSYYADKAQCFNKADYPIFLAEIASTTNEVLLLKYLYNNSKDKNNKIFLLERYLHLFSGTIFTQAMFSEFEDYAHKELESGQPISVEKLSNKYGELLKFYRGKGIKLDKLQNYYWLMIPHFYNSYYVYKYATGLVSAACIANEILTNNKQKEYIEFLSSGGSDYPYEILKKMGVDLNTDEPYNIAFKEMDWALKELDKLI